MLSLLVAGLAALTGLVLALLIWRARKPLPSAVLALSVGKLKTVRFAAAGRALARPLAWLAMQDESRYRSTWIMLIGEQGAGKSSLLASVSPELWQAPSEQQARLVAADSNWRFLAQGVLIDPDGALPGAAAGSEPAGKWQQLLAHLDELRPERPLDGVLLVLSARSLLENNPGACQALAESLRAQLAALVRQVEFALPVYVVVSSMDSIDGCQAFWHTQGAVRRNEMMGWSMPAAAASEPPAAWVDSAFDSLAEQLRRIQVQAAAQGRHLDPRQADQFFLFPRHFLQLRAPLRQCMEHVFQASSWQSGGFCRGLYFTGAIDTPVPGAETGMPRADIAFIDDLVSKKIFAEPQLARPSRKGSWSRSILVRRAQMAGVALMAVLLVSLAWAGVQLQRQSATLRSSLAALETLQLQAAPGSLPAATCIDRATLFQALEQIARIRSSTVYWAIPASWIDRHASADSLRRIAQGPFEQLVLAGIACQLEQQAHTLMSAPDLGGSDSEGLAHRQARKTLLEHGDGIVRLQQDLQRFSQIVARPGSMTERELLAAFIALCTDTYQAPPASLAQEGGALGAVLRKAQFSRPLRLPADMAAQQAAQLADAAQKLARLVEQDAERGSALLAQLERAGGAVLPKTQRFASWLDWVGGSWAASTDGNNPCQAIEGQMQQQAGLLRAFGYPDAQLLRMAAPFSSAQCYQPVMRTLGAMQIAPYGSLFAREGKLRRLNPQLQDELAGLKALGALAFMQVQDPPPFSCQAKVAGWRAADIGLSNSYVADYDRFLAGVAAGGAAAAGQKTLYQRVGLQQLERSLNGNLNRAQIVAAPAVVAVDASASEDQALAAESGNFAALLEPLLTLQRSYQSKGFAASQTLLNQCISNYSSDSLARVQNLAENSRLYVAAASNGSGPMFDLGTTAVIKDFLARQQARAQVLAGYATAFLGYLNNAEGQNMAQYSNTGSPAYWSNTITELNNYVQFKEPNGAVGLLDNLFLKQMPTLDAGNCSDVKADDEASQRNDLFSKRRLKLQSQIMATCKGEREAQASSSYTALAARFNRELAGHYPFGPLGSTDASVQTVRQFFADYTAQSGALRQSLQGLNSAYWTSARQFLAQLDSTARFFQGTLNLVPAPPAADPAKPASAQDDASPASTASTPVRLSVQFNAQPGNASGADQLVAWTLSSGSKAAAFPNRSNRLDWEFGQGLILDLSWASGSLWLPAADLQQSDLQTSGVGASFAASGDWALLRMIEKHRPSNGVLPDSSAPNRLLLEFLVPVVSNTGAAGKTATGTARLYLGLNLSGTDPKTHAPVSLRLPRTFPTEAP